MNYLITGGEFNNKGAEGMTLTAISNIVKNDSNAKIYLLSKHTKNPFVFKCDFQVLECPQYVLHKLAKRKIGFIKHIKEFLKIFIPGKISGLGKITKIKTILSSIDFMIDISGYQLSSKWDDETNIDYCCWINVMHSFGCKIYLMPQSFGPFNYSNNSVFKLLKTSLPKCTKIYAREEGGYLLLNKLGLTNIEKCFDSVLQEKELDLVNLIVNYGELNEMFEFNSNKNIAIIPNKRLADKGGYKIDDLLSFYEKIILNYKDYSFYLVSHAGEDLEICKAIKGKFLNEERVHFIDHVLLSFNYQKLVANMDFIIASRYHSIIHAYKECTPAVILGWSNKYEDVASAFEQKEFVVVDINNFEESSKKINLMNSSSAKQKEIIKHHLEEIQKNNCYSFLIPKSPLHPIKDCYCGFINDPHKLLCVSSGGAATILAGEFIRNGGLVIGVKWAKDYKSCLFKLAKTPSDLDEVVGTKYISPKYKIDVNGEELELFRAIQGLLESDEKILLFGLGCHIGSVLTYLNNKKISTKKLYTVDILCHGPALDNVHLKYIEELEKKAKSKLIKLNHRYKKENWIPKYIKADFENGETIIEEFNKTSFGKAFHQFAKPQCSNCHYKGTGHRGDICLGDYWGASSLIKGYNEKGTSIIFVQSEKGYDLLNILKHSKSFEINNTDYDFAVKHNLMYLNSRKSYGNLRRFESLLETHTLVSSLNKINFSYRVKSVIKKSF